MPHTGAQPAPLTKSDYLQFRNRYIPAKIKTIFVLESPPASGKYFYNPDGTLSEPLFRAMTKDVLEITPKSKDEGLKEFAARGYFLIDATYTPINRMSETDKEATILHDLPMLVEALHEYAGPETGIVLVKVNVCKLLEDKLREEGFKVLNHGTMIPFPTFGRQKEFRQAICAVLGITTLL